MNMVLAGVAGTCPNGATSNLVKQVEQDPRNRAQYWIQMLPPSPCAQPPSGYFWLKNLADGKCMTSGTWLGQGYVHTTTCTDGATTQFWSLKTAVSPL